MKPSKYRAKAKAPKKPTKPGPLLKGLPSQGPGPDGSGTGRAKMSKDAPLTIRKGTEQLGPGGN